MNYFYILIFLFTSTLIAQKINVLDFYTYSQLQEQKPALVLISTDWCMICKIQKEEIEKDIDLLKKINTDFLFVELNAETYTKDILLFNRTFEYYPNGTSGLHELAHFLTDGENNYPLWVFLDKNGQLIGKFKGLISADNLKKISSNPNFLK